MVGRSYSFVGGGCVEKKWKIIWAVTVIICVMSLSLFSFMLCWTIGYIGGTYSTPTAALNSSKQGDNYTITVTVISFPTEPIYIRWYVCNESGWSIASNDFPTASGDKGSTTNHGVIVTWFDNDKDGKLSTNDTIRVYRGWHSLSGYEFWLLHTPYTCKTAGVILQ